MGCQVAKTNETLSKPVRAATPSRNAASKPAKLEIRVASPFVTSCNHLNTPNSVYLYESTHQTDGQAHMNLEGTSKSNCLKTPILSSSQVLSHLQASPNTLLLEVGAPGDSMTRIRSKLSMQQSKLDHLRQKIGYGREMLSSTRDIPKPQRQAKESLPGVRITSGCWDPSKKSAFDSCDLSKNTPPSQKDIKICSESASALAQRFVSTRCIRPITGVEQVVPISDLSVQLSSRRCSKSPSKFRLKCKEGLLPPQPVFVFGESMDSRPRSGSKNAAKKHKTTRSGNFLVSVVSCRRIETSKRAPKQKSIPRNKLEANLQVAEQSPQDGPSLFQRSNSTRLGKQTHQRAATCVHRPAENLLPTVLVSDDDNSEEDMLPAILDMSDKSLEAAQHSGSDEPVQPAKDALASSLHLDGADELGVPTAALPRSEEIVASKREIKQINVLKGKSSPFNITIKARETQLIKNATSPAPHEDSSFRKNLLPIKVSHRTALGKLRGNLLSPSKKLSSLQSTDI